MSCRSGIPRPLVEWPCDPLPGDWAVAAMDVSSPLPEESSTNLVNSLYEPTWYTQGDEQMDGHGRDNYLS